MRIAFFAESFLPKLDGVTNTLCYLLDHLAARGIKSLMFAPEGAPPRYADTTIVGLSSFSFPFYPELRLVPPLINVREELEVFGADLVHVVNPVFLGLVGLREAKSLGIPTVASYHTDIPGYAEHYGMSLLREPLWSFFRWIHNKADLNYCPSHFTELELVSHGFERVKVWPHGVDTSRFNPLYRNDTWRERLSDGNPEAPLLVYVGRLGAEKRVGWLKPMIDAVPDARLAIVGDGPMREELEELLADTPTVFTGFLRGADLSHAYASADVFVFPSANETFGNVVLEAMASALPVIAPRSGGPVDHVRNGQNGFLFDPQSQRAFIDTVKQMLSNPSSIREMGVQALDYARTQSWEVILDKLLEDYGEMIAKHSALPDLAWRDVMAERWQRIRQMYEDHTDIFRHN